MEVDEGPAHLQLHSSSYDSDLASFRFESSRTHSITPANLSIIMILSSA